MDKQAPESWWRMVRNFAVVAIALIILLGVFFSPVKGDFKHAVQSATKQTAHTICLVLYQYSIDHDNHYPQGQTSTEVFQKLIDGKYAEDPAMFYVPLPGKVRPLSFQLKPENVSWDVTCCVDFFSPNSLPIVYLTGFKVNFRPGSSAERINPIQHTWETWWNGPNPWETFMAMCDKENRARVFLPDLDGSIPNFIPADFDSKGKTYRQLTP